MATFLLFATLALASQITLDQSFNPHIGTNDAATGATTIVTPESGPNG